MLLVGTAAPELISLPLQGKHNKFPLIKPDSLNIVDSEDLRTMGMGF